MKKDLEYFKEFLADPASFKVGEFYQMVHEWAVYISAHKDEFNYLEDEEWREIRERLIAAFEIKEDLRLEFEELEERLDALSEDDSDQERIAVYMDWLAFMKEYQAEYGLTDEQVKGSEAKLNTFIVSVRESEIAEENLKISRIKYRESIENLADSTFEHFERTGKRPVLTALQPKKKIKGN